LIQALDEGLISGAGFDVLTVEPPCNGHPLLNVRRRRLRQPIDRAQAR
jgi:glycerate dehydrogenase